MLKYYTQSALRQLAKNRLHSAINIGGLAVGLTAFFLIMLLVQSIYSVNSGWQKDSPIYQLGAHTKPPGRDENQGTSHPGILHGTFVEYFASDVDQVTRFMQRRVTVRTGTDVQAQAGFYYVDAAFADMFELAVISGSVQSTLADKTKLAVSRAFAARYFGSSDPIGETLAVETGPLKRDYVIAAVFDDVASTSTLQFEALALIDEADWGENSGPFKNWNSHSMEYYLTLKDGVDADRLVAGFTPYLDANAAEDYGLKKSETYKLLLAPLEDVYLETEWAGENKPVVIAFMVIAVLVLAIAVINYTNLLTASAVRRAREVAMRKTLGASRGQLVTQFVWEAVFVAFLALLISLALAEVFAPVLTSVTGFSLTIDYSDPVVMGGVLLVALIAGVTGAFYPALHLSAGRPSRILTANKSTSSGSTRLRSLLVVFQFAISVSLIIGALVVYGQTLYAINSDRGYDSSNVLVLQGVRNAGAAEKKQLLRDEVKRLANVEGAAFISTRLPNNNISDIPLQRTDREGDDPAVLNNMFVGFDFFEIFDIEAVAGRVFHPNFGEDNLMPTDGGSSGSIVLNQLAVTALGYRSSEDAIGNTLKAGQNVILKIVGVIPDVHFGNFRNNRAAETYIKYDDGIAALAVKFKGDPSSLIVDLERLWADIAPAVPFSYYFVDERISASVDEELTIAAILGAFAALAVIIACMGLYGLAAFTVETRTKEIGIRKVLGAGVWDIVKLLVSQFSKPVMLANLLAWPLTIWFMTDWLEQFPDRLDSWVLLPLCLGAGLLSVAIAWGTVGGNALRVARTNPIEALRQE